MAERLGSLEDSRALAATRVGRRPRAGASRANDTAAKQLCEGMWQQGHEAANPTAGQVGPLGLPALACMCCRHVIQPHWVPQDHGEALAVPMLDLRRCCCAPPWRQISGPPVPPFWRAARRRYRQVCALCDRRGALCVTHKHA